MQDVLGYFQEVGVKMVVRLNEKLYDASLFEYKGIQHVEMVRTVTGLVLFTSINVCSRTTCSSLAQIFSTVTAMDHNVLIW